MDLEKLKRLQAQVRIGGKGTPRRKKKVVHKSTGYDDKNLQGALKKLSVNAIPGIEEVNIIKDDLTVIHFNNPKVKASLPTNTFVISGNNETKKVVEMIPDILPQLRQDSIKQLHLLANTASTVRREEGETVEDDDDVPTLVNNFDSIAVADAANSKPIGPKTEDPLNLLEKSKSSDVGKEMPLVEKVIVQTQSAQKSLEEKKQEEGKTNDSGKQGMTEKKTPENKKANEKQKSKEEKKGKAPEKENVQKPNEKNKSENKKKSQETPKDTMESKKSKEKPKEMTESKKPKDPMDHKKAQEQQKDAAPNKKPQEAPKGVEAQQTQAAPKESADSKKPQEAPKLLVDNKKPQEATQLAEKNKPQEAAKVLSDNKKPEDKLKDSQAAQTKPGEKVSAIEKKERKTSENRQNQEKSKIPTDKKQPSKEHEKPKNATDNKKIQDKPKEVTESKKVEEPSVKKDTNIAKVTPAAEDKKNAKGSLDTVPQELKVEGSQKLESSQKQNQVAPAAEVSKDISPAKANSVESTVQAPPAPVEETPKKDAIIEAVVIPKTEADLKEKLPSEEHPKVKNQMQNKLEQDVKEVREEAPVVNEPKVNAKPVEIAGTTADKPAIEAISPTAQETASKLEPKPLSASEVKTVKNAEIKEKPVEARVHIEEAEETKATPAADTKAPSALEPPVQKNEAKSGQKVPQKGKPQPTPRQSNSKSPVASNTKAPTIAKEDATKSQTVANKPANNAKQPQKAAPKQAATAPQKKPVNEPKTATASPPKSQSPAKPAKKQELPSKVNDSTATTQGQMPVTPKAGGEEKKIAAPVTEGQTAPKAENTPKTGAKPSPAGGTKKPAASPAKKPDPAAKKPAKTSQQPKQPAESTAAPKK